MRTERYIYSADSVSPQEPPNVKVTGVIKLMCPDRPDSFVLQTVMLQSAEPEEQVPQFHVITVENLIRLLYISSVSVFKQIF